MPKQQLAEPKRGVYTIPRLFKSDLTNRVFVVTKWRHRGGGIIEAIKKYDVTDDFNDIFVDQLKQLKAKKPKQVRCVKRKKKT